MSNTSLRHALCVMAISISALLSGPANAQTKAQAQEQIERELSESWRAASRVAIRGPRTTDLGVQGMLQVPPKMAFVPVPEASRILRALGNTTRPDLIGLVTSTNEGETWFATISFKDEGYIRDDDAKVWNADELLTNLKEGTEQSNKDRRTRGFSELERNPITSGRTRPRRSNWRTRAA